MHRLVYVACLVSAAISLFSLQFVKSFGAVCAICLVSNFQTQPTWSQLDQVAIEMLDRVGGDYGKQRFYGSIGYGIRGLTCAVVAATFGFSWCFNLVLALSSISIIILLTQIPVYDRRNEDFDSKESSIKAIFKQRDVLLLFVLTFVLGILGQAIDSFLFLFYFGLANTTTLIGLVIVVETASELPLFFHVNTILARVGVGRCVHLGIFAYVIRLAAYSIVQNPWYTLPIELLHGWTFGLVWAAVANYAYQSAPVGMESTVIKWLASIQRSIGGGVGTVAGGWIYEHYGARAMWSVALFGVVPVALILAVMFSHSIKAHTSTPRSAEMEAMMPLQPLTATYTNLPPRVYEEVEEEDY